MSEFTVGTSVASSTSTVLPNGNIVVVWQGTEAGDTRIRAQVFDAAGNAVGAQFVVDDDTGTNPEGAAVTVLDDGNLAITWIQPDGSAYGVKGRVMTADGTAVTDVFQVNTTTVGNQSGSTVTALDDGGFVVVYQSGYANASSNDDGSGSGIRAQIYDASGNPVGTELLLNDVTAGHQTAPVVAALDGGFVAVYGSPDADGTGGIRARLFDSEGTALGGEFEVTGAIAGEASAPTVTLRSDGGFLVTWNVLSDPDTGATDVVGRMFSASGVALGDAFAISDIAGGFSGEQEIVQLTDGRFVAVWTVYSADWSTSEIYGRAFDANGAALGDSVVIGANTEGYLASPTVSEAADGSLVVSWQDDAGTAVVQTLDVWASAAGNAAPGIQVSTGEEGWLLTVVDTTLDGARGHDVADLDGDGDLDIVATTYVGDSVVWYENDGGNFGAAQTIGANINGSTDVAAGDIDGDGDVDLVAGSYSSDQMLLYVNDGSGNFTETQFANLDGARDVRLADLDGDGDLDVLAAGYNGDKVVWYANAGDGTLGAEQVLGTPNGPTRVITADMDGDGDLDVLAADYFGNTVQYYQNLGAGTFAAGTAAATLDTARGVAAGDLDGDGDLDVVGTSYSGDQVLWFANAGDGSLGEGTVIASLDGADGVTVADVDGDGDLDVVATGYNADRVVLIENLGDGTFAAPETVLETDAPWEPLVADLDGSTSILVTAYNADTLTIAQRVAGTIALTPGEPSPITGLSFSDDGTDAATVHLKLARGVLTATSGDGVTVDGDGTNVLTLTGSVADINAFIAANGVVADVPLGEKSNLMVTINDGSGADNAVSKALIALDFGTPPSDVALSSNTVSETAGTGTVIGELSATDPDGDALTYTLADDAGGLFGLVVEDGVTKLVLLGAVDYETATSHTVSITVSDGRYETTETLTVDVINEVEGLGPPQDITLSNTTMSESARTGAVVGILSATDLDGDDITYSLDSSVADNEWFQLKVDENGVTTVVLTRPLDFESSAAVNGVYQLVVDARDEAGNVTRATIDIQSTDEAFDISSVPTGQTYMSVVENVDVGTELGYIETFDGSFTPVSAELIDDSGGKFAITTRVVDGTTLYYLVTNGDIDFEAQNLHSVTVRATDAGGVTKDKTFQVHILDAAETGDTARGTITIDASTLAAAEGGGVNWDTYLEDVYAKVLPGLPMFLGGGGWSASDPASEFLYTGISDGSLVSISGSDLVYNWSDPVTGEDIHVVSGTVDTIAFGTGDVASGVYAITDPEVTITGLDLQSGATAIDRIQGEVNILAQTWMYGPDANHPQDIDFVKSLVASYAQNFVGSDGDDTYTGTLFDDTITGGGGSDTIDGGEGNDTARYEGVAADYDVVDLGGGAWRVTHIASGVVDELTGIEALDFFGRANTAPTITLADDDGVIAAPVGTDWPLTGITFADGDSDTGAVTVTLDVSAGTLSATSTETVTATGSGSGTLVLSGTIAEINAFIAAERLAFTSASSDDATLDITVDDGSGSDNAVATERVTLDVQDLAPEDVTLSANAVSEDAAVGTVVGVLSATDPEGGALTYRLADDASGRFGLSVAGNGTVSLVVTGALDYELASSHAVTVEVEDAAGNVTSETFTIVVGDVFEATDDMIVVDATGSAGMDFDAYLTETFLADATSGGFPVFDNGGAFTGEEMMISYGSGAASKYVTAHGELAYEFSTHTVHGTINTLEFGTRGSGTYDSNGYFSGGNAQLRITGLDFYNARTPEADVEANGPVHNFAVAFMYGATADPERLQKLLDDLDEYGQNFVGSGGDDVFSASNAIDLLSGKSGDDKLEGLGGNDAIDGGLDVDTAVFSGRKSQYSIVHNADGTTTITDLTAGRDGTDTLRNIEFLQFSDVTVGVDPEGEPPENLTLSARRVQENAAAGTVIGKLSATDPEGGALTYRLGENPGDFLTIVGNELRVAKPIDYETTPTLDVVLQAIDEDGNAANLAVTIEVLDVAEPIVGDGVIIGTGGNDELVGGDGDDVLNGLAGADRMAGGKGDDTYFVDDPGDRTIETDGDGIDTVKASVSFKLAKNVEILKLTGEGDISGTGNGLDNEVRGNVGDNRLDGRSGDDKLGGRAGDDHVMGAKGDDVANGGAGRDRLQGGAGDDLLKGGLGADELFGGGGDDRLIGHLGRDQLTGGVGADKFFLDVADHSARGSGIDRILDFSSDQGDRIVLNRLDADVTAGGKQAFAFVGTAAFSETAGELRWMKQGTDVVVAGDLDGDGEADFHIRLENVDAIGRDAFLI